MSEPERQISDHRLPGNVDLRLLLLSIVVPHEVEEIPQQKELITEENIPNSTVTEEIQFKEEQ